MNIKSILKDFAVFWCLREPDPEPSLVVTIELELIEAGFDLLKAEAQAEYWQAMCGLYRDRAIRLNERFQGATK